MALEADVQIYAVILNTGADNVSTRLAPYRPSLIAKPWDRAVEQQGPEMLERLSDRTGGLHYRVRDNADAEEAVTKVGRALRDEYLIGYRPATSDKSGKLHRIRVKLNAAGTQVHARKGYYAQ